MSIILQNKRAHRSKILRSLSLTLTVIALPPAIALFAYDMFLYVITHPASTAGPFAAELIPLPITGWQAVALLGGPAVLMIVAIISIILDITGRWQARKSQPAQAAALPTVEAAQPQAPQRPRRWGFSTWLALCLLLLGVLEGFMPDRWLFDTGGDTLLNSVAMVSPSEGWAVGAFLKNVGGYDSVIWHYHNGKWARVSSPTQSWLRAVTTLPDGEAWAVGLGGMILHERGGKWTQVKSGTTDDLEGIVMTSPSEGWAVGGAYDIPIALAGDGPVSSGAAYASFNSQPIRPGIAALPKELITCRILHYTNGQWLSITCPVSKPLESVAVLPDGEAWAVGMNGIILHEHQGVWTQVSSPTHNKLNGIAMASPTEGWAVGLRGTILHYQYGTWTLAPALTADDVSLSGVVMVSAEEGWIVGDGDILHESKGVWTLARSSTDWGLFAVTMLPGGQEGWAVGADPLILHEQNGIWSVYSK